jgi:MFS superfamily sulfate permease-like transporter
LKTTKNEPLSELAAIRQHFPRDLLASVVVFLVALPLCMGIAIASGVPPALGLITGIVGGLVVGVLAGSPLQVSGPAAGLAVLVYQLVDEHGLAALGVAVVFGGVVQIIAGVFRIGRWFRAVSPMVIQGMLAGIGALILGSQFHVMVDDSPKANGLENLLTIPSAIQKGLFAMDWSAHQFAAIVGVTTIGSLVAWNQFKPKKLKAVPGPLVGVVLGTVIATFFALPIEYVVIPADLTTSFNIPTIEGFGLLANPKFLQESFAVGLIASAETLLCASAVDRLHDGPRTRYDKELIAQGIGNVLCGAVGALPMTGVIVRSSANVEAGGKTRMSAILHGAWLLILVVAFPFVLELIPRSALAAILVFTGWKLLDLRGMRAAFQRNRVDFAITTVTVLTIVATDLLTGVIAGIVLSFGRLIYTFSHLTVKTEQREERVDVLLEGAATFLSLPHLADALEGLPVGHHVHVHLDRLVHVDYACLEQMKSWSDNYEASGGTVVLEWDHLEKKHTSRANMMPRRDSLPSVSKEGAPDPEARRKRSKEPLTGAPS